MRWADRSKEMTGHAMLEEIHIVQDMNEDEDL